MQKTPETIAFENNYKDLPAAAVKLTLRNERETALALSIDTAAPFSATPENLILAPYFENGVDYYLQPDNTLGPEPTWCKIGVGQPGGILKIKIEDLRLIAKVNLEMTAVESDIIPYTAEVPVNLEITHEISTILTSTKNVSFGLDLEIGVQEDV